MSSRSLRRLTGLTAAALSVLLIAACGDNSTNSASEPAGAEASAPAGGRIPEGEPDVNGDGKVVIGVLSPGDTNDNGYYESFVTSARDFAAEQGWEVIIVDKINPANAVETARNICRQRVDLVAIGASELKDAIPVAEEPVCADTAWYVSSGMGVTQTPYIATSQDRAQETLTAAGYAAGLLMKEKGWTKAGFVAGPEADFTTIAYRAFRLGIRKVVPQAEVVATYTGSFDDAAKAQEATNAQLSQGVQVFYPYLGGATDAAAKLANSAGVPVLTPGTDRCDDPTVDFAISVIFSPGDYFTAALKDFAAGKLAMGVTRVWHLGKDPVPTVKLCDGTPEQNQLLEKFIADVGSGAVNPIAELEGAGS